MRKHFARVYNSIRLTDIEIGKLLDRLDKDHLRDSTIIFFFADHGEGEPRGKTNGINLGYRVPFVVWIPEMYKDLSPWGTGGVVSNELVDFEDLAPTLISLAGGSVPDYMHGRILMGKARTEPVDHLVLSEDRSDNGIDMVRTVTNGRYVYSRNFMPFMPEARYIRYMEIGEIKQQMRKDLAEDKLNPLQKSIFEPRPAEFLFDIQSDLWETHNLVDDPSSQAVLNLMRSQLEDEILSSRDVMFLPEYEIGLISDTITPFEFRLKKDDYPLEEIWQAAKLSGKRGGEVALEQVRLLKDNNRIRRYWAAVGLRSQDSSALRQYKSEIIHAMQDTYPPVAITAAAIAYGNFNNSMAAGKLKQWCASDNMDLALMAINYLIYTPDKQPFIETIRSVHEMPGRNYNVRAACMDFLGSLGLVPNNMEFKD